MVLFRWIQAAIGVRMFVTYLSKKRQRNKKNTKFSTYLIQNDVKTRGKVLNTFVLGGSIKHDVG